MSPDHPNAKNLKELYEAMGSALHEDSGLTVEEKAVAFKAVSDRVDQLLRPDFVIHTNGIRLGAHGDRKFTMIMGQRRNALCNGTFRPVSELDVIADDVYAVIRFRARAERADLGLSYDHEVMGAWRFDEEGRATEHWEQGPALSWDEFWIACDPGFEFSSGEEFWLKDVQQHQS